MAAKGSFSKEEMVKTVETLIKQVETAIKMMDHSKKSIVNNRTNVHDAEAGAPGSELTESKKALASAEDLYLGHKQNGQQKLNILLLNYERTAPHLDQSWRDRYTKLIEGAKSHGLSTN